jgi:hypothetical protein
MNPRIPPPKVAPLGIPVATGVDNEQVNGILYIYYTLKKYLYELRSYGNPQN